MAEARKTSLPLGLTKRDFQGKLQEAELVLTTSKHYNGGLESSARVDWIGEQFREHAAGMGSGLGDYNVSVMRDRAARATQAAIDKLHAAAFPAQHVETLRQVARDYYAAKVADGRITDTSASGV